MRHVLAALDLSPAAGGVLRAALDIAASIGAKTSLLRVITRSGEMPESEESLRSAARWQLRELVAAVPPSCIGSLLATTGDVWREICQAAQTADADLVVLGARSHVLFERALGTTAAKVVNHCDRSVLVVRGWRPMPTRMLVALDDSGHAAVVREYAVALARRTRAKVRLFRAVDMPPVVPADMLQRFPTIADAVRNTAGKALGPHEQLVPPDLRDGFGARLGATAWREICAEARDSDADLIVLGSRGYGMTDRLLGSTAGEVVDHADRSTLVVRRAWREPPGSARSPGDP